MWSLGCILGEMLCGKPLFQGNSTINQIERIVCALPKITNHDIEAVGADFGSVLLNKQISRERRTCLEDLLGDIPDDALDLVKSLLVLDPLARLTAPQALEHPYITKFRHSIVETDLDTDIIPPFSDDVRLTVPQYRAKLYEIVDDVPIVRANRSASSQAKRTSNTQKMIHNYEKRTHSKTKIPNTQNLERKESRDLLPSAYKNTSEERLPMKNNSPQIKTVPIKTMMSTLPTTKSVHVLANNDVNVDGKQQRRVSRKQNKVKTVEAVSSNATINSVDKCTEVKTTNTKVQVGTQSSQESLQANAATATVENVRSLIKKRVSSNTKLTNSSQNQTLTIKPTSQQQQQQQPNTKPQALTQQQLQQYLQKQQQQFYKQQQQQQFDKKKIIKEQTEQQHQQQVSYERNRHTSMVQQQQQQQQLNATNHNQTAQNVHSHKHCNHIDSYSSPIRTSTNFQASHLQRKSSEHGQISQHSTELSPTTDSLKNIRQRINNALAHSEVCKLKSQNATGVNRETGNSNEMIKNSRDKRTKSAEYTINRQGMPTMHKDNVEDVHCYEERLRRIEEEINCYKNEVKSYAYDNLRSTKPKPEMAPKSCDRVTPMYKQNCNVQAPPLLYNNQVVNKHFNYSPTSSSSRCSSSDSDVPQTREIKSSFTNFPTVYTKNSFYQFLHRHKAKPAHNNLELGDMGTGGSGDHISEQGSINRPMENQQRLQFKRSVTNLIKAHLKPAPAQTTTTMQPATAAAATATHNTNNNLMFTNANEYRYKSSSRRKTTTKAF